MWSECEIGHVWMGVNGPWVQRWSRVSRSFRDPATVFWCQLLPEVATHWLDRAESQLSKVDWGFRSERSVDDAHRETGGGTYISLCPFNPTGSGTPRERYTIIGAKPTTLAIKKRKRRHMQRLRRTVRWVIKRGSTSLSYTKPAVIVEEKGVGKKLLLSSASRYDLGNMARHPTLAGFRLPLGTWRF